MNDNIVTLSLHKYNLPALTIELIDVNPGLAREWLDQNTNNRNLRKANVEKYGRDMRAGEWSINGSTIVFSTKGVLLDGQHRLHAVIEKDATVPLLVVRGVVDKAKHTIDDGAKRRLGDRLKIDDIGAGNRTVLASLLRRGAMWDRGNFVNTGTASPTTAEMYAYLDNNPGVLWSSEFAAAARSRILAPMSVVALSHWVTTRVSSNDARWFFDNLITPANLPTGHAIHALDAKLKRETQRNGRADESELLASFILAWNAYREGRSISKIQMPKGGLRNSNFPLPK